MCCSCTTEQTFAWVSAIVVNTAFLSLISWGASANLVAGFVISIIYTVILFVLARFVDRDRIYDESETDAGVSSEVIIDPKLRRTPPLVNLLYGLFVLALGVTGFLLSMNIFTCDGDRRSQYAGHWSTNITDLPEGVQSWAIPSEPWASVAANFVFIPGPNVTLFTGSDDTGEDTLWSVSSASVEPVHFPSVIDPSQFIVTGTGHACFYAYKNALPPYRSNIIGCCNGTALTMTRSSVTELRGPYDFVIDNNTLWFKDLPPTVGSQAGDGELLYSISNYDTMEAVLHSTYREGSGPRSEYADVPTDENVPIVNGSRGGITCAASRSILALFVSAIPVSVTSVFLWMTQRAPSMAITSFVGFSSMANSIFVAIRGNTYYLYDFNQWWLSISGALYVLTLVDLLYCKSKINKFPLVWGINFGSLVFFVSMIMLTGIFVIFGAGSAWRWVVFNILTLLPLGVLGLATNQVFLLVLCAVGWLIDSVRLASWISGTAVFNGFVVPVFFVVLAISGLLIASAGWLLSKHQEKVHQILCDKFESLSVSKRIFSGADMLLPG